MFENACSSMVSTPSGNVISYIIGSYDFCPIISTLLGHSSVNITGKIYINKDYTNEQDAVNTLDKILT